VIKSAIVVLAFVAVAAVAVRLTVVPRSDVFGAVSARHVVHDALRSDTGRIVHLDTVPRGALIVQGYTRCTDACPLALAKVVAAARPLHRDVRPSLFFLTVDPAYDTAPVLRRYLAVWQNDVTGLTGEPHVLRRVSASLGSARLSTAPSDHDTRLFLVDRSGDVVREISPDIAADELRRVIVAAAPAH
jgi:cytochrome oxidase Cu insertion factor (SCO1/SenC/PrrC family)